MRTVYLCGAIAGCNDSQCKDWREFCKIRLADDYRLLDPMRRDYRGTALDHVNEIVCGDYKDVQDSDIVLAMVEKPSWGTAMEIHKAFETGKYVVLVTNEHSRISPG